MRGTKREIHPVFIDAVGGSCRYSDCSAAVIFIGDTMQFGK